MWSPCGRGNTPALTNRVLVLHVHVIYSSAQSHKFTVHVYYGLIPMSHSHFFHVTSCKAFVLWTMAYRLLALRQPHSHTPFPAVVHSTLMQLQRYLTSCLCRRDSAGSWGTKKLKDTYHQKEDSPGDEKNPIQDLDVDEELCDG